MTCSYLIGRMARLIGIDRFLRRLDDEIGFGRIIRRSRSSHFPGHIVTEPRARPVLTAPSPEPAVRVSSTSSSSSSTSSSSSSTSSSTHCRPFLSRTRRYPSRDDETTTPDADVSGSFRQQFIMIV